MIRTGSVLIALCLMLGCASVSNYYPKPVPVGDSSSLQEFRTGTAVAIVNGASDSNSEKRTAPVVTFMSQQLEQRGAEITGGAERKLQLEVVDVKSQTKGTAVVPIISTAAGVKEVCQIVLKAETGDGYVKTETLDAGARTWRNACDQAATAAVVNILNDPKIRTYLAFDE